MRRLSARALFLFNVIFLLLSVPVFADAPQAQGGRLVDEIVATIDDVPVLRSDVELEVDFGLLESPDDIRDFQRLLDSYLNRLLILKELDDIGGFRLSSGQAEGAYMGYLSGFDDRSVFDEKLQRWGIEEGEIFKRLERALLVSLYTESRIKFFVKVLPSDIEKAYEENPKRWGEMGVFEAWETIRSVLVDESFELEKRRWLASLRERYHLVLFEMVGDSLQ